MRSRDVGILVLLLSSTVGCDQVSKQAAIRWLSDAPTFSYLGDTFRLTYTENHGAFLGLGAEWPDSVRWVMFTLLSTALVAGASFYVVRIIRGARVPQSPQNLHSVARLWMPTLGPLLVVAGGVGNLIDRVLRDGAVVDFMNLGIGSLRTGIFNVADVYIMVGIALWALWPASDGHASLSKHPTRS